MFAPELESAQLKITPPGNDLGSYIFTRKSAAKLVAMPKRHHGQFPRHQSRGLPDYEVNRVYIKEASGGSREAGTNMTENLLLVFPALMIFAATSDILTMKIPNWVSVLLVTLFLAAASIVGVSFSTMLNHAGAGLLALLVGFGLFAFGWVGGGDAKLAAGIALWLGPNQVLLDFLLISALAGGALTVFLLALRSYPLPGFALSWAWLQRLHDKSSGIPYGVALAAAALAAFPRSPMALMIMDLSL